MSSPQQPQHSNASVSSRRQPPVRVNGLASLLAAILLGIFILISALILSGRITKFSEAFREKSFYAMPVTDFNVKSDISQNYFTLTEAAEYLRIPESALKEELNQGRISNYIQLSGDSGYIFSKEALDEWFKNASTKQENSEADS